MIEKLRVSLIKSIDDSYDIIIGKDLFFNIVEGLKNLNIPKLAIITDSNVSKLYGNKFLSILKEKGIDSFMLIFPAGEENKNRNNKEKIEDVLISQGLGRDGLLIALGGGVVGDLGGFIASTYMRGIPFLQIPTTLLAMIDSSIGGKTGLDTSQAKNIIGTFYQPKKVFIDIDCLKTLSKEEMINGLAEMVKHAIIKDEKFFVFINDYLNNLFSLDEVILIKSIKWSCMIKKSIVELDELESSSRKLLNFGHTIGHAIEKASEFSIKHGNAIALGMIAETNIAKRLKMISQIEAKKIVGLIERIGFNTKLGDISIAKIIENIKYDKKNREGKAKYVLPTKIGNAEIDKEVSEEITSEVLGEMK